MIPIRKISLVLICIFLLITVSTIANAEYGKPIDLTYDRVTLDLDKVFSMRRYSNIDGFPRYKGLCTNKLGVLEVVGPKHNIVQATLAMAFIAGDKALNEQNTAIMLLFLNNISSTSEWPIVKDWFIYSVERFIDHPNDIVKVVVGVKEISLRCIPKLQLMVINVRHN